MIYYTEADLSPYEVPNEQSLCIYISGCQENCYHCHYPDLRRVNYGTPLKDNFQKLLTLYFHQATCICFLGEGENTLQSRAELTMFARQARVAGKKTCLYSGRNVNIEEWMKIFDYVKAGSFQKDLGGLDSPTTNQMFYKKCTNGTYQNITSDFWK